MCGIAGIHHRTDKRLPKFDVLATNLLLEIENRGIDSTGFAVIEDDGDMHVVKTTARASRFVRKHPLPTTGRTILLHTRFATVGTVSDRNAHPVKNGPLVAVHNGTIQNDREVFAQTGRPRNAEVDSEVIPAVVAHHGWDSAEKALARLRGGAATAIIDTKQPGEVILARLRSYPLHVYVTSGIVVWASTRDAIERAWMRTYGKRPRGGEWMEVPEFTMLRVNGSIRVTRIPQPPKPTPTARPHRATGKATARKPEPVKPQAKATTRALTPGEQYEQDVRDLMRWTGRTRDEVEDILCYGALRHDMEFDSEGAWVLNGFDD